jgi:hypothetical protein
VFCRVCCFSKSYAHTNNCKNTITCCEKRKKKERKKGKSKKKNRKEHTIAKSRD